MAVGFDPHNASFIITALLWMAWRKRFWLAEKPDMLMAAWSRMPGSQAG